MGSYILLRDREIDSADSTNCVVEETHSEFESELPKRLSNSRVDGAGNGAKAADVKQRLKSLDVFRGLTVALMILVDDAGGVLPTINHSPWNGVTLADFVMPFFLFIVGVALALVYKNVSDKVVTTQKAILRTIKIFILGIILQGGYFHGLNNLSYGVDLVHIRWLGVLQRIAIGYFMAAMSEIWLTSNGLVDSFLGFAKKYCIQWVVAVLLSAVYVGCLYGLYVPDWQFEVPTINFHGTSLNNGSAVHTVKCGLRGSLGPACNAVRMIDYSVLGVKHLYQNPVYKRIKECSVNSPDYGPLPSNAPVWCQAPFDPEGLLSSVMSSVTCFIGLHFGHILVNFKGHRERILNWIISSLVLILFGIFLEVLGMPLNKALYTFSYMCITSGAAGLLFSAIYLFVDMYGYRRPTVLLEWMGLNALLIYALAACDLFAAAIQGFYWRSPQNNVVTAVEVLFETIVHSKSWGRVKGNPFQRDDNFKGIDILLVDLDFKEFCPKQGFIVNHSDGRHSTYVSLTDEQEELVLIAKLHVGQFIYVNKIVPGTPIPYFEGPHPTPDFRLHVGTREKLSNLMSEPNLAKVIQHFRKEL